MLRLTNIAAILALFLCLSTPGVKAQEALTWQDCVAEARANNPDLVSAQESINQSRAGKSIAKSDFFPQIGSSVSASRQKSGGSSKSTNDTYSYGVTGSQLIFDGFKTLNNVNSASQDIIASQEGYRLKSSQVRYRLRAAFINLLRAQELVKITREIADIRISNLELIKLRYESGIEHRGALLTAEANLAQANLDIAQARRAVELAQRQLLKEMGRPYFSLLTAKGDFEVLDTAVEKPDFAVIVENNPGLLQLIAQKNAASFNIRSAYGNFFPTISGAGSAGRTSSQWPPRNDQWSMGLSMSFPIFEGGLRIAQLAQATAVFNQLKADEVSSRDSAIVALEQAWVELQDAIGTVVVQQKMLIADEERSRIAQAQYSNGYITYDNWTIIEDNLVSSKKSFLNSQAAALLAEANWIQAKGETLEDE